MKTIKFFSFIYFLILIYFLATRTFAQDQERLQVIGQTGFRTEQSWRPGLNLRTDVVFLDGVNDTFPQRCAKWQSKEYRVFTVIGLAYGEYKDFIKGKWDGTKRKNHFQINIDGKPFEHKPGKTSIVPDQAFISYLMTKVKYAIDNGADGICLAYPEYWTNAGYSKSFKSEWDTRYDNEWQAPDSSATMRYQSETLKYELYSQAVDTLFSFAKNYSTNKGSPVQCYVLTRSLIHHAYTGIIGPVAKLMHLPNSDGLITEMTSDVLKLSLYGGVIRERLFETMLIEYGTFATQNRVSGKDIWLSLQPPSDLKQNNWQKSISNLKVQVTAALFYPEISHYDLGEWPEAFQLSEMTEAQEINDSTEVKKQIEKHTDSELHQQAVSQMLTIKHALENMQQYSAEWDAANDGIGILISDAALVQLALPDETDLFLHSFYGITMPLLKHGVFVQPLAMENLMQSGSLKGYKVLFMSYRFMKPLSYKWHERLAQWVRAGGSLIFIDDDSDPYDEISDWWSKGMFRYSKPVDHLFEALKIGYWAEQGKNKVGMGSFYYLLEDPAEYPHKKDGPNKVLSLLSSALPVGKQPLFKNHLMLRRGPYLIAAVFDETQDTTALKLSGNFVSLFDPALTIQKQVKIKPGEQAVLFDLMRIDSTKAQVLAGTINISNEIHTSSSYRFTTSGPTEIKSTLLIYTPSPDVTIRTQGDNATVNIETKKEGNCMWIEFMNQEENMEILLQWSSVEQAQVSNGP